MNEKKEENSKKEDYVSMMERWDKSSADFAAAPRKPKIGNDDNKD